MTSSGGVHPLDRPVWSALTTRQAHMSIGGGAALRFAPEYGPFGAAADGSAASLAALAALIPADGGLAVVEAEATSTPPGAGARSQAAVRQMLATELRAAPPDFDVVTLTDADAPEMLALATLTRPGPFSTRTHAFGGFVGVKRGGRLVAMAGERMKVPGFSEVSGVCTHPDARGQGYARGLMGLVAAKILARGEVPFLHAYATNTTAIALYEALGFVHRRTLTMTVLDRAG